MDQWVNEGGGGGSEPDVTRKVYQPLHLPRSYGVVKRGSVMSEADLSHDIRNVRP
jgi:hypothetical protein